MATLLPKYLRLFTSLKGKDLGKFTNEHQRLMQQAKEQQDYTEAARHYYNFMTPIIEATAGKILYQPAPEYRSQSQAEATRHLHYKLARFMQHGPEKKALDIGCTLGEAVKDVAWYCGGHVTGVTPEQSHVDRARAMLDSFELQDLCQVTQGGLLDLPFKDNTFDCAYTIGPYKYVTHIQLPTAFKEAYRVIKPGGLYVLYGYVRTKKYDAKNPAHVKLLEDFEYSVALPPSKTNEEIIGTAEQTGFSLLTQFDLSLEFNWSHYLNQNSLLMWIISSQKTNDLIRSAESANLVPKDFTEFNKLFLMRPVTNLVELGKTGILSCTKVWILRKKG